MMMSKNTHMRMRDRFSIWVSARVRFSLVRRLKIKLEIYETHTEL